MATRLADVAQRAGVSLATASRALSGSGGVSDALVQRVKAVAAELGYVANAHARSLASGVSGSVGLIVHEIGDPYFAEIATGVMRAGNATGATVQVCHTGRDHRLELEQIRSLVANRIGSIIIAGSGPVDAALESETRRVLREYRAAGGRVAAIGRHHLGVDCVLPDNVAGAETITDHLTGLGHRRIGFIGGSRTLATVADRLAGAERGLAKVGIQLADLPVFEQEFTRTGGRSGAERLLRSFPDCTAIFALNDHMAIGVLSTLRRNGIDVPGEISVAGFDDIEVAEDLSPALTTVRLPMVRMGELALELTRRAPSARPRRRRTTHELIVRDSTAVLGRVTEVSALSGL